MVNHHKDSRKQKQFIIYTPDHVKDVSGLNVYAIYPDYWGENVKYKGKHNWGEVPCLGFVKETSEYWAQYAAFSAGLLPANATFNPRAVQVKTKLSDLNSEIMKHQVRRRPYKKYHPSTVKK